MKPEASRSFAALGEFRPAGDLWTRLSRNYNRLEEEKYWPENVFQREIAHETWPGDTEGRTMPGFCWRRRPAARRAASSGSSKCGRPS